MKINIATILFSIVILGLSSCTRDNIDESGSSGKQEGKSVKVELSLKIPSVVAPLAKQSRTTSDDKEFSVDFFEETAANTRAGSAELYNLWLFQFHSDGTIHGAPQRISDEVNMVNDQTLLPATLRVGTNQTLYILVLGKKVTPATELGEIRTLSQLEHVALNYLENRNGLLYCSITNDSEVPYGGSASGVSVREIDESGVGEIVYGTPDGFFGGIEIKQLVARIQLKHKLDLTANTLEGLKLLKVPSQLFVNPASIASTTIDAVPMVDLEAEVAFTPADKDINGFFTTQWYIAQNKQGTKSGIMAERDRYRKVDDTTADTDTKAPLLGTNIEIWSYSNTSRSLYTVHQIYVGNNNTSNFDVEINHNYNLRTIVNSADLADGRIRSHVANQEVYFASSGRYSQSSDGTVGPKHNVFFDAHYGWRPIIIYAQGRKVSVSIYKDYYCTQKVDLNNPTENWLQLSAYSNYTDAVRNGKQTSLVNHIETNIFLPTRFKLYLYADEYVTNEDGSITDYTFDRKTRYSITNTNFFKQRTLYVKVVTEEISAEGTPKKINATFTISQQQGYYAGLFGGQLVDGQYTHGLMVDTFDEYLARIDDKYPTPKTPSKPEANPNLGIYYGYDQLFSNYSWSLKLPEETNYSYFVNGKEPTYNLATNPDNLVVNKGADSKFADMIKINGAISLYQYDYYRTFAARFCHDVNRDKNGNGVIDYIPNDPENNEFEWYLPSTYQALGMLAAAGTIDYYIFTLATEIDLTKSVSGSNISTGWYSTNFYKNDVGRRPRCVRDIPVPDEKKKATKVTTYTDEQGEKYIMIDLSNMPNGVIDRTSDAAKEEMNEELDLYSYSTSGQETNDKDPADISKPMGQKVIRAKKSHSGDVYTPVTPENLISCFSSAKFIVSPTDVYNDGDTKKNATSDILQNANGVGRPNNEAMLWAEANGRLNTANTQPWHLPSQATMTGCYAYRGKNGTDERGTWRVPTLRELSMILMFAKQMEKYSAETGFQQMYIMNTAEGIGYTTGYWSSTLHSYESKYAAMGAMDKFYSISVHNSGVKNTTSRTHRLRCIKDVK